MCPTPSAPSQPAAPNPDADLLADDGSNAATEHESNFTDAENALIRDMTSVYGNLGAFQATPGYVPGRFIMKARSSARRGHPMRTCGCFAIG